MPKSNFTERYDHFRRLLVEARRGRGLTQAELANKLGKPQSFVSKFERGERRIDIVEFLAISQALSVDPHEILERLRTLRGSSGRRGSA